MPQEQTSVDAPETQLADADASAAEDQDGDDDRVEADVGTEQIGDPDDDLTTRSQRLYIIDYGTESERKRAEYTLKNWEDADIERPNGTIRIVETEDQEGLMNQLITKIPYDHIRAFDLDDVKISENIETLQLERTLSAPKEGIETTLEFMMSQRDGLLLDPDQNKYEVDDKGPAEVSYEFTETESPDETGVIITIEGAPQTTQHLLNSFRDELDQFERNRRSR